MSKGISAISGNITALKDAKPLPRISQISGVTTQLDTAPMPSNTRALFSDANTAETTVSPAKTSSKATNVMFTKGKLFQGRLFGPSSQRRTKTGSAGHRVFRPLNPSQALELERTGRAERQEWETRIKIHAC